MKKYVKAARVGKTKSVYVVQEYTGYGNGWEDIAEYEDTSSESWKQAKADVKDYKDNGYSARIITRRVPNPAYQEKSVESSEVTCATTDDVSTIPEVIEPNEVYSIAKQYMSPEEIDHHESDLYLKVTPVSSKIIEGLRKSYPNAGRMFISTFISNIEPHDRWYEVAFAYPGKASVESSTDIKASESVIYEDDSCKITDFGNGQAEYFDDRTNFYLPTEWANKIADKIKEGKIERANTLIAQAERKFYDSRREGKEQKWVHTELNKEDADQLKYYLKKHNIYYEPSLMDDGWIHFEVKATDEEVEEINKFLDSLDAE